MIFIIFTALLFATAHTASVCLPRQPVELYRWNGERQIVLRNKLQALNPNSSTYFIVHGWTERSTEPEVQEIAINYYTMDPTANIILVDYRDLSKLSYTEAINIVNQAGTLLGNRIVQLIQDGHITLNKIQMFGHSLGAHVCGKAAQVVKSRMNGQRIPRISVTDPAGPFYRLPVGLGVLGLLGITEFDPLQKSVTDFLDITHTSYTMGTIEPFGHVDTYVGLLNGNQPACRGQFTADSLLWCDHRMARSYFTESVLSCGFKQRKSLLPDLLGLGGQKVVYGQHMPLNTRGIFHLDVNKATPYAKENPAC